MTIPSSGVFSSDTVAAEWGYGKPFSSDNVIVSTGLTKPFSSESLRGRSSTMTVSVDTAYIEGYEVISSSTTVWTGYVTCLVNGGQAPYAYSWEFVSNGGGTIIGPNNQSVAMNRTFPGGGGYVSGVIRCRVQDARGTVVYSPNVSYAIQAVFGNEN